MRIQVITRDNGFGLTMDIQVIREALPSHTVDVTSWDRPRHSGHWDWNIHLELVNPAHLRSGTVNVLVPNPEWMEENWVQHVPRFNAIWAKTKDCADLFARLHPKVEMIGWTSPDPGQTVDYTRTDMVHCVGASISKGTNEVLAAAAMVPEARVTVLSRNKIGRAVPPNVTVRIGHIPEVEFNELRRTPIHLCPSSYEGFGHYINEARAMGALIVSTDAPPMDEVAKADHAILVPHCAERRMRRANEKVVCVEALADAMRQAMSNVGQHGKAWGAIARSAYEWERTDFHQRINAIVK